MADNLRRVVEESLWAASSQLEAINHLAEDGARFRRQMEEAFRPTVQVLSGLVAFERQMADSFRVLQSTMESPWARMFADFERSLPAFRPPDIAGLFRVMADAEPLPPALLDKVYPLVPTPVRRIVELEARVEQLEQLLQPPSPPDDGEDTRPMPGQYL